MFEEALFRESEKKKKVLAVIIIMNVLVYFSPLTSPSDSPCFTITALPEDPHSFSADQPHFYLSSTEANTATNAALHTSPTLLFP